VDAIGRKERREEKNVVAYWEEFDLMGLGPRNLPMKFLEMKKIEN
jgi:hypothetical protein